jgi:hypothetical protein
MLVSAIHKGLAEVFGKETAKAVEFYVDPHIALHDANAYSQRLTRIFGKGAELVIKSIEDALCEMARVEKREWRNLGECVEKVKEAYRRSTT